MADVTVRNTGGIHRVRIGLNVGLQLALVLFLVAMVNYLGFEHYRRWDLSRDKKYALSDKTRRFLRSIPGKVRLTVFFGTESPIAGDVQSLLTEYQYASKGKIDVENVDPARNFSRAKEVSDKYKVVTNESMLIADYEGRSKTVKASEMAEMTEGNQITGESSKVSAFKGEQALTSALIDLVEGKKNIVGYVIGHKEPDLTATSPISILKTFIENENIKVQEVNLADSDGVPSDIKTLFIDGPQYDFSEREMKVLRAFWDKQGRILLLLDPAAKPARLLAFLNELGVIVNDDRLMAVIKTGIKEVARVRDVVGRFLPDSPITKRLAEARGPFLGATASLTLEPDRVRTTNTKLQPLVQAEKGYWGELDYDSTDDNKLQFDPARDHAAPLTIAVSIEKGGSLDERVQMNSARMVAVSNASFILNTALTQDQQALDFVSGSINWLLSREQLIGIAPKIPKMLTFDLDDAALTKVRWLILVFIPLVPGLLGFAVYWQRRA